eukprot:6440598-Amphidinium_carterae.2
MAAELRAECRLYHDEGVMHYHNYDKIGAADAIDSESTFAMLSCQVDFAALARQHKGTEGRDVPFLGEVGKTNFVAAAEAALTAGENLHLIY